MCSPHDVDVRQEPGEKAERQPDNRSDREKKAPATHGSSGVKCVLRASTPNSGKGRHLPVQSTHRTTGNTKKTAVCWLERASPDHNDPTYASVALGLAANLSSRYSSPATARLFNENTCEANSDRSNRDHLAAAQAAALRIYLGMCRIEPDERRKGVHARPQQRRPCMPLLRAPDCRRWFRRCVQVHAV